MRAFNELRSAARERLERAESYAHGIEHADANVRAHGLVGAVERACRAATTGFRTRARLYAFLRGESDALLTLASDAAHAYYADDARELRAEGSDGVK